MLQSGKLLVLGIVQVSIGIELGIPVDHSDQFFIDFLIAVLMLLSLSIWIDDELTPLFYNPFKVQFPGFDQLFL